MAAGYKRNWAVPVDSGSWEDDYSVTTGADDLKIIAGFRGDDDDGGPSEFVIAVFDGTTLTEANFQGLPVGSLIINVTDKKLYMVDTTTTIVASAALT